MNKKFMFIAALVSLAYLNSCKKKSDPPVVDTLTQNLEANFKFSQNLTDGAGKVGNGISAGTSSGFANYTSDRAGNANSALLLNGASRVTIPAVFFKGQAMSISAWVKYEIPQTTFFLIRGDQMGIAFVQRQNQFGGSVSVPQTNSTFSNDLDNNWHHVVVTYDASNINLYIDGNLNSATNNPGNIPDANNDLVLGFFNNTYWKGSIDELRIYSRLLTTDEIKKLAAM